ncbi:MAG: hypothetical protein J7L53_07065 [Deltaproteobacteria bacterium]|nr:hypothetical protein [Deltaproteobacteria bacterium]
MIHTNSSFRNIRIWVFIGWILMLVWGCSGSGGSGTKDYRPEFLERYATDPEEFYGDINYPVEYTPPRVIIEEPISGAIFPLDREMVTVAGRVEEGDQAVDRLLVNGEMADIGSDGTFSVDVPLVDMGVGYACIDVSAVDTNGYSGRDRIAILRGTSVPVEELSAHGIGLTIGQKFLSWLELVDPLINHVLSQDALIDEVINTLAVYPTRIDIIEPFKAEVELTINDLGILEDNAVTINSLKIPEDTEDMVDAARLLADLSLKGLEIDVTIKFISLFGIPFPDQLPPSQIKIKVNDIWAEVKMLLDALDPYRISIKVEDLDTDINGLEIILVDFSIFDEDLPIEIKDGLAWLLSLTASELLDNLELVIHLPQDPFNMGMINNILKGLKIPITEGTEPLDIGSMIHAGFSAMDAAFGISSFFGDASHFGVSLDLAAWASDDEIDGRNYHDYDEVIYLPPTISVTDALSPLEGTASLALAISGDILNRVLSALTDIDLELFIPGTDLVKALIPGLKLPENTVIKISLNAPPFVDFREETISVFLSNLMTKLYMNTLDDNGLQLSMALDLIAEISPEVSFRDGDYYLDLDLSLPEFNVFYLVDRMGIHQALDIEHIVDVLIPQIVDILKEMLGKTPLKICSSDLEAFLERAGGSIDPDNPIAGLLKDLPLPEFAVTIPDIRVEGGYVSVFINLD